MEDQLREAKVDAERFDIKGFDMSGRKSKAMLRELKITINETSKTIQSMRTDRKRGKKETIDD
jgi:hypothetical protein